MELFRDALKRLEKSKLFKDWKKKNPKCYLSSGFVIIEKNQSPWKAGYYNKAKNKITSFVIDKKISLEGEEDIFQKKKEKINEIDIHKLLVELPNAVVIGNNLQQEKYKGNEPVKIIAILQNVGKKQIWNLIFVTQKMNTLNIRVDTENGDILEHKIASIMDMRK